jgi:Amt family ammonium transporter
MGGGLQSVAAVFSSGILTRAVTVLGALGVALASSTAFADEAPAINGADTAWMIVATALVLFMTLPGLALFYGGLVRSKNVLSIFVQCFALAGVMTLLWVAYGYSLAFGNGGSYQWAIGNLDKAFMKGVTIESVSGSIPESLFAAFQMTFAIITPALVVGAFAERMKFKGMMLFSILWFTLSYLPICHMAWAGEGALFHGWGVLDFAGGTVVHVNAGIAGLVTCIMLGRRSGYPKEVMRPHNLPFAVMGAGMLWVGWFGFNAGSELAADGTAAMALLVTHIAAATATVVWMAIEMMTHGKASALGVATGAVAGLVAITPASGTAGPLGAVAIGAASAVAGYYFATSVKHRFGYDDSLDVFGVHGVGGVVGALLTGVFVSSDLGGKGFAEGMTMGTQVWAQAKSVLVTIGWSGVVSVVAYIVVDKLVGMRVPVEVERGGLDLAEHQEQAYEIV